MNLSSILSEKVIATCLIIVDLLIVITGVGYVIMKTKQSSNN